MPLFLLNIFGWIASHGRIILIGLALVIVIVASAVTFNRCKSKPHLDEKQIQKNQDAIASKEHDKLVEALVESRVAEKQIDDNLANAKAEKVNAIAEAKKEANSLTNEQLAAELEALK